mgnify:CR=1 FL=1
MTTTIANPIYDLAFKYLMEDERVVKILLSALLRKQVVHVETRRCRSSVSSCRKKTPCCGAQCLHFAPR